MRKSLIKKECLHCLFKTLSSSTVRFFWRVRFSSMSFCHPSIKIIFVKSTTNSPLDGCFHLSFMSSKLQSMSLLSASVNSFCGWPLDLSGWACLGKSILLYSFHFQIMDCRVLSKMLKYWTMFYNIFLLPKIWREKIKGYECFCKTPVHYQLFLLQNQLCCSAWTCCFRKFCVFFIQGTIFVTLPVDNNTWLNLCIKCLKRRS